MLGTSRETAVNGAQSILNHVQIAKEKGSLAKSHTTA